jgi:hypothetical protein
LAKEKGSPSKNEGGAMHKLVGYSVVQSKIIIIVKKENRKRKRQGMRNKIGKETTKNEVDDSAWRIGVL